MIAKSTKIICLLLGVYFTSCGKTSSDSSSISSLPSLAGLMPPVTKVENRGGIPFEVYKNWTYEDWCLASYGGKYLSKPLSNQISNGQVLTVSYINSSLGSQLDRDIINKNPELPRASEIKTGMLRTEYLKMVYGEYNDYVECHMLFEYSRRDPLVAFGRINFKQGSAYEFGPLYSLKRDDFFVLSDQDDACVNVEVLPPSGYCDTSPGASKLPVISIERLDVMRRMATSQYQVQPFNSHPRVRYADGSPVKHFRFLDDGYDANAKWFKPKINGLESTNNQHISAVLRKVCRQRSAQVFALPATQKSAAAEQLLLERSRCFLPEFVEANIECGYNFENPANKDDECGEDVRPFIGK